MQLKPIILILIIQFFFSCDTAEVKTGNSIREINESNVLHLPSKINLP